MSSAHPLLHLLLLRLVHQEHVVQQAHQQNSLEYAQTILAQTILDNLVLSILTVIFVMPIQIMKELHALKRKIAREVVLPVSLVQFVLLTVSP